MRSKIYYFLPFLLPIILSVFFAVYPPKVSESHPAESFNFSYEPLMDTPDIKHLMRKQAGNDSFRRANRVKNFRKLEEIDRKLAKSEADTKAAYQMTKEAVARKADAGKEPDKDDTEAVAVKEKPHGESLWDKIFKKSKK